MTETDRLRELLELAAPTDPDVVPGERSRVVARRGRAARTRGRVLVGAAAAAVVVAAVAVPLSLRGDDAGDQAVDRPDELPAAYAAAACPAEPVDVSRAGTVAGLPAGAVSVRLCPATDGAGTVSDWSPERAALVGAQVDAFLAYLADEVGPFTFPQECLAMSVAPRPWALQVTYADRTETVGSTMTMCGSVTVAGKKIDVAQVTGAFFNHMTEQLTGRYGPPVPAHDFNPPACADPVADTWDGFGNVSVNARVGRVCRGDGAEGLLSEDQTAALADEIQAGTTEMPTDLEDCLPAFPMRIRLVDPWGDITTWTQSSCGGEMSSSEGYWMPSAQALAVLDGAVSR